jgi:hypothetical protein
VRVPSVETLSFITSRFERTAKRFNRTAQSFRLPSGLGRAGGDARATSETGVPARQIAENGLANVQTPGPGLEGLCYGL